MLSEQPETIQEHLERFGVSMPSHLLAQFDEMIRQRGFGSRSEAIRSLARGALVESQWQDGSPDVVGVITLVYAPSETDTLPRLRAIQREYDRLVPASLHIDLGPDACLEVVVARGRPADINQLTEQLVAVRGVMHGRLTHTTSGNGL